MKSLNKILGLFIRVNQNSSLFLIIFVSLGFVALGKIMPDFIYILYAFPSSYIASLFIGQHPILTETNEILIPASKHFIEIIPNCSGYGFFCLLYAIFVSYIFRLFPKSKALIYAILIFPCAYVVSIITNGCRIICAYKANEAAKGLLPNNFQAGVHLGIGIALFLSVILVISLFFERRCSNG